MKKMNLTCYFCVLLSLLFFISCADSQPDVQKTMHPDKLSKIVHETNLNFPEKSEVIYFFEPDRFVDPVWVAKVKLPSSAYEEFKGLLLQKPPDNSGYEGAIAGSVEWWSPQEIILKKQYLADQHTLVDIVLSKEGEDIFIYVECAVF